jgi:hypothetical protein
MFEAGELQTLVEKAFAGKPCRPATASDAAIPAVRVAFPPARS